jgi:hypothetical protein
MHTFCTLQEARRVLRQHKLLSAEGQSRLYGEPTIDGKTLERLYVVLETMGAKKILLKGTSIAGKVEQVRQRGSGARGQLMDPLGLQGLESQHAGWEMSLSTSLCRHRECSEKSTDILAWSKWARLMLRPCVDLAMWLALGADSRLCLHSEMCLYY